MSAAPARTTTTGGVSDGQLKQRVHSRLLRTPTLAELEGVERGGAVRARLAELLRDEAPLLQSDRFDVLLGELLDEVAGLGPLEPLLADPLVTEVMINGPGRAYVERAGRLEPVELELDATAIVRLAERVIAPLGLRLDRASPIVDARLDDGSRVHAVIPPLAIDGPCLTIRRFPDRALSVEHFGGGAVVDCLHWTVAAGWNLLVAGGTGAGKTTLLNALSRAVPAHERVITIEETAELRLQLPHVIRLESRLPNAEGAGGISVRELVRTALRMRPDRIVVGEVRGPEALDMLQALNTGHDGSLTTVHANSAADALTRLETLVLLAGLRLPLAAVRAQISSAIDAVIQVTRDPDGSRRISEVVEILDGAESVRTRGICVTRNGAAVLVAAPRRPPRRHGVPPHPAVA